MPFKSTRPGSLGSWSKWRVTTPGKARLSKQHGLSILLSRSLGTSLVLLDSGALNNGTLAFLKYLQVRCQVFT